MPSIPTTTALLPNDEVIFGRTSGMDRIRRQLEKFCRTNVPVLIEGECGTGKEMLARWIHRHSLCMEGPFIKVSFLAIPGTLLESELFGFEQGAFTGAVTRKAGRVESAQNGTLFLDGIAEMELGLQAKLLQFLQDGSFSRIGGLEEQKAVSRVITATDRNLEKAIVARTFRRDLFYRVNVLHVHVPALRERREDIPVIAEHWRRVYSKQFGVEREPLSEELARRLQSLEWPGNLRELSNTIARYVLIGREAIPAAERTEIKGRAQIGETPVPLKRVVKEAVEAMERSLILETLRANHWNRRRTAQQLKISYRALIYKIREAGIVADRLHAAAPHRRLAEPS